MLKKTILEIHVHKTAIIVSSYSGAKEDLQKIISTVHLFSALFFTKLV